MIAVPSVHLRSKNVKTRFSSKIKNNVKKVIVGKVNYNFMVHCIDHGLLIAVSYMEFSFFLTTARCPRIGH